MLSRGRGWWVRRADMNTVHVLPLGGTCGRRGDLECEDVERARPEAVRQLERLDALDRGKDSRIDLGCVLFGPATVKMTSFLRVCSHL